MLNKGIYLNSFKNSINFDDVLQVVTALVALQDLIKDCIVRDVAEGVGTARQDLKDLCQCLRPFTIRTLQTIKAGRFEGSNLRKNDYFTNKLLVAVKV